MNTNNRVEFKRPDYPDLTDRFTVVDMHFHSNYSDGIHSIGKIAKRVKELGIGIAVTDHNEIQGAVEIADYPDIFSIPGIEITSREGSHLLVYFNDIDTLKQFYKDAVFPFMGSNVMSSLSLDMEEIILRAKAYSGVIIFPHPYCAAYTGICNLRFPPKQLEQLLAQADGVEGINAGNLKKWNLKGAVLGFNLGKAITGGSDGHSINHMGKAVSYAICQKNPAAFLNAVKNCENKVVGKEIPLFGKMTTNSRKLKNNFSNYPDIFEKNVKYMAIIINSKSRSIKEGMKKRLYNKVVNH